MILPVNVIDTIDCPSNGFTADHRANGGVTSLLSSPGNVLQDKRLTCYQPCKRATIYDLPILITLLHYTQLKKQIQ